MSLRTRHTPEYLASTIPFDEELPAMNAHARLAYSADAATGIVFQNAGLIDIAAVTTMGVSVKADGAIGYFGTGLKFAIATILRHKSRITIYRGLQAHAFDVAPMTVRGESFDQITMNGEPLGFTTQLGRDWEPWMAFRELASNCRDEGGSYWIGAPELMDGLTTIVVQGDAMEGVWSQRREIMLEGAPLAVSENVEVREGPSAYVYYRGVRIFTAPRPTAFTYNILSPVELTEDRTAKDWWQVEIAMERCVGAIEDRSMLRRMMTCGQDYTEHHMDIPRFGRPQETFRAVARELAMGAANIHNANPKAVAYARKAALEDMREGDGATLNSAQSKMLTRARSMLESGGFRIGEFPVIVCDTLGPDIHGMAKDGRIFMSLLPFRKGTREVAATLLEEYAHLKSGDADCTRGFQNWLFDQLLVQAENVAGEPF